MRIVLGLLWRVTAALENPTTRLAIRVASNQNSSRLVVKECSMVKERKRIINELQAKTRYGTWAYLLLMVICIAFSIHKFYSSYVGYMYIVDLAEMHQIRPPTYFGESLTVSAIREFKGDPVILTELQMRISASKHNIVLGFVFLLVAASVVGQHTRYMLDKQVLQLLQTETDQQ